MNETKAGPKPQPIFSGIDPEILIQALNKVKESCPGALLYKNQVGNLTILDQEEEYVGWVDLRTGEVTIFAEEED